MDDFEGLRQEYNGLMACEHPETEVRKRPIADGRVIHQKQCLFCGAGVGAHLPQRTSWGIKEWDLTKPARRDELEQLIGERSRELGLEETRMAYRDTYLLSEGWLSKAAQRLEYDGHECQARMAGCTDVATQVHHTTYAYTDNDNPGNEPLFVLVSVCNTCHKQISRMEGRR